MGHAAHKRVAPKTEMRIFENRFTKKIVIKVGILHRYSAHLV